MRITLDDGERKPMNATVDDEHFVGAARDAAWAYLLYIGSGSVTARHMDERIVTVSIEYHDD